VATWALPITVTRSGTSLFSAIVLVPSVVPMPSTPTLAPFIPQHQSVPSFFTAQA
jgi:hypothetical protein